MDWHPPQSLGRAELNSASAPEGNVEASSVPRFISLKCACRGKLLLPPHRSPALVELLDVKELSSPRSVWSSQRFLGRSSPRPPRRLSPARLSRFNGRARQRASSTQPAPTGEFSRRNELNLRGSTPAPPAKLPLFQGSPRLPRLQRERNPQIKTGFRVRLRVFLQRAESVC